MLLRLLLALALAAGFSSAAPAQGVQVVPDCAGIVAGPGTGGRAYQNQYGQACTDALVRGPAAYAGNVIAAGGASQSLLAANPVRRGFTVQNQSSADLYIKIGGAAATLDRFSLRIAPGALYETPSHHVSVGAVAIIGATTGQAFYATEF